MTIRRRDHSAARGFVLLRGAEREGQRMKAARELGGEQGLHSAMAIHSREPLEHRGHERDGVVRLDPAFVTMTLIRYVEADRPESPQSLRDSLLAGHAVHTASRPFGCQTTLG